VLLDNSLNEIDRVAYDGGPTFPDPTGAAMALADPALDNNVGANWCTASTPYGDGDLGTPGTPNPACGCGDTATPIHAIQGSGTTSLKVGEEHTIEGIVVGDFQRVPGNNHLSGFFVQEEDSDWDGDITTSEGIFVYEGSSSLLDVQLGDKVRLTGTVDEYYDLTELKYPSALGRCSSGNVTTAVEVTLPETVDGDLEQYEGMLVEITSDMTIAQNYFLGRYGQMTLSASGRLFQPTNQFLPGSVEALTLADANARSLLILDDGMDVSDCGDNPVPVPYLGGPPPGVIRAGDQVGDLVGVLDYGKINSGTDCGDPTTFNRDYRLHPTEPPVFTQANLRTTEPADVGSELKVASFNVLNYFTTLGSRGADNQEEFDRQRDKIFAALAAIDADVVGLIEIENNTEAVADLVTGLNDVVGPGTYAYVDTGIIGMDEIKTAFIYKPATVSLVGDYAVLDDPSFTDPLGYGEQKSRPALAQTFMNNETGGVFTAVVNHFKSKGSECGPGDDDPEQGNCNLTRTLGAQALASWLATDPTASGDPDFLVIGDLNAYAMEDPIMEFLNADHTDLLDLYQGETAYTYIFDGLSGYLDHALANQALLDQVTGATAWHINADEPPVIDYDMDFNPDGYYSENAYRSSDHDPVIVGLDVCDEIPPTLTVSVTPDTLWPPNHKYVTVVPTIEASDNFDPNPTVTLVSVVSNEPDNGLGDGDTPNDIVINPDGTIDLRAERFGGGDGRIYTLTYMATDACGNSTEATATVTVPKSQGKGKK
jgi:predicted extracellular nuclease